VPGLHQLTRVDCGWADVKSWQEFLPTLPPLKVGLDPKLIMIQDYNTLLPTLHSGTTLVPTETNLVDQIWTDQPPRPTNPIVLHPLEHAGQSTKAKLVQLRAKCKQDNKWGIVVSLLDEVSSGNKISVMERNVG
jgi:Xaa-Pro aminopeptidase